MMVIGGPRRDLARCGQPACALFRPGIQGLLARRAMAAAGMVWSVLCARIVEFALPSWDTEAVVRDTLANNPVAKAKRLEWHRWTLLCKAANKVATTTLREGPAARLETAVYTMVWPKHVPGECPGRQLIRFLVPPDALPQAFRDHIGPVRFGDVRRLQAELGSRGVDNFSLMLARSRGGHLMLYSARSTWTVVLDKRAAPGRQWLMICPELRLSSPGSWLPSDDASAAV